MKPQATQQGPEIKISCLSNVYVRRMLFSKEGIVEVGHRHPYSHTSLVASGSIAIQVYNDNTQELLDPVVYHAPSMVMIEKNIAHQITSLEDNTVVCCIHALRDETETIIDPEMIPVPTSLRETIESVHKQTGKFLIPPALPFDDLTPNRVPRMFNARKVF
jgi:dTDP-4-dehydrorhamnose 3,5-epimerase-like enzyme